MTRCRRCTTQASRPTCTPSPVGRARCCDRAPAAARCNDAGRRSRCSSSDRLSTVKRSPIGAHVFVAGGLASTGLRTAERYGAEVVQVFVSNPRGWRTPTDDIAGDEAFRVLCAERGIGVFVHAPYLCNFASPTDETRERTVAAVAHSLVRGQRIGAAGVVVHAGSAVNGGQRDVALTVVRELVLPLLD